MIIYKQVSRAGVIKWFEDYDIILENEIRDSWAFTKEQNVG